MLSILKEIDIGFKIPTPDTRIRVAVTGFSQSGKSVFITSLINQLLANDKLPYLNEKIGRAFVARLLPPDNRYQRFDYYANLKAFQKDPPSWPKPTKQVSKTTIQLEFKSEYQWLKNQIVNLEIVDYPGEWLLDLSMLDLDFERWSHRMLELAQDEHHFEYAQSFQILLEEFDLYGASSPQKDEILFDTYKEYLKMLYYNHFTFIQPGRFLEPGDLEGDPILHFTPLPAPPSDRVVDENSIYARFQKRYDYYLKEVVNRLYIEHFSSFDAQIVLVDLIKTLEHGQASFEDMNLGFKEVLKSFTYGHNSILNQWFAPKIDHVIFAATKADYIPRNQHEGYRQILEDLIRQIQRELHVSGTKTETTILSAVKSTEYLRTKYEGKVLDCIEGRVDENGAVEVYYPGEVPRNYRLDTFWQNHHFQFPQFLPRTFPKSENQAVDHIRMDRLIYSLLEGRV